MSIDERYLNETISSLLGGKRHLGIKSLTIFKVPRNLNIYVNLCKSTENYVPLKKL